MKSRGNNSAINLALLQDKSSFGSKIVELKSRYLNYLIIYLIRNYKCNNTIACLSQAIQERHENSLLKTELEKLREENKAMRETINKSCCPNCDTVTTAIDCSMSTEEKQLLIENAKLKAEVNLYKIKSRRNHQHGNNNKNKIIKKKTLDILPLCYVC